MNYFNNSNHIEHTHFVRSAIKQEKLLDESQCCENSIGLFVDDCVDIKEEDEAVSE
jgi:hypothetical protein